MEIRSRPCRSSSRSDLCLQSQGLPTTSTAETTTLAAILPAWRSWCSASHRCSWCQWHGILCLFAWRRNFHRVMGLLLQAWSHSFQASMGRALPWTMPCTAETDLAFCRQSRAFAPGRFAVSETRTDSRKTLLVEICCGSAGSFFVEVISLGAAHII